MQEHEDRDVCQNSRCIALERLRHHVDVEFANINAKTDEALRGVNNFHKFEHDSLEKLSFIHGAAKAWSIILSVVLAGALTGAGWAIHAVYPAIRQIMADYYSHHPDAKYTPKSDNDTSGQINEVHINPPISADGGRVTW